MPIPVALSLPDGEVAGALVDVDESRELGTILLYNRTLVVRSIARLRVLDLRYSDGRDPSSVLDRSVQALEDEAAERAKMASPIDEGDGGHDDR